MAHSQALLRQLTACRQLPLRDVPQRCSRVFRMHSTKTSLSQILNNERITWESGGGTTTLTSVQQASGTQGIASRIASFLLPAGYPSSVAPSYTPYALGSAAAVVVSSAGGVLSMQCMLYSVGLGSSALPLAAGVTWVLKDGLGQLGGVMAAALINTRFDADPKRWRFLSALLLDTASALEIATAFYPPAFLLVASVANGLKNVAWLASSATRANIHQALSTGGNLADITAKSGSQTIGAATLGTALGVSCSTWIGQGAEHLPMVALAFGGLSLANLLLLHTSLSAVVLPTLSPARLWLACEHTLTLTQQEGHAHGLTRTQTLKGSQAGPSQDSHVNVRTPNEVSGMERFFPTSPDAVHAAAVHVSVNPALTSCSTDMDAFVEASRLQPTTAAVMSQDSAPSTTHGPLGALPHMVHVSPSGQVSVLHCEGSTWRDTLLAHLHALRVAVELKRLPADSKHLPLEDRLALISSSRHWLETYGSRLVAQLEQVGWWVGTPLLESDASRRVVVANGSL